MKKGFLIAIAVFGMSILQASEPERVVELRAKVHLDNNDGYFVFADGSCWKVIAFQKRWRTISEWWNDVKLVPDNYECLPNDWVAGTKLEVYSKYQNMHVNDADASNQAELRKCTHILTNTQTGQILFAIALHPGDCLVQVFNDGEEQGYKKGYQKGTMSAYQNADDIYKKGINEGYRSGYAKGYQDAVNGLEPQNSTNSQN